MLETLDRIDSPERTDVATLRFTGDQVCRIYMGETNDDPAEESKGNGDKGKPMKTNEKPSPNGEPTEDSRRAGGDIDAELAFLLASQPEQVPLRLEAKSNPDHGDDGSDPEGDDDSGGEHSPDGLQA